MLSLDSQVGFKYCVFPFILRYLMKKYGMNLDKG